MAEIRPFRGVLYNKDKVGSFDSVMAPPYDVISPARQRELYDAHPNNIVRLILGVTNPDDTPENDRYTRAAADLKAWMADDILKRDEHPSIYYYTQTYTSDEGETFTRKGYIALCRIEEFGKGSVHPHEKTLSGPKADRLKLMQACNSNLSCIFSIYSDPQLRINAMLDEHTRGTAPIVDLTDEYGIVDRVWKVDDPEVITKVTAIMSDKPLYIADGHHRYETSLNYRNYMRDKNPGAGPDQPYDFVMMYFSNMDDHGMTIWPTHRVIHSLEGFDSAAMMAEIEKYFDVTEFPFVPGNEPEVRKTFLAKKQASARTAFGLHVKGEPVYRLLTLKGADVMDKAFGDTIPEVFKDLDVTVLHALILNRILGITQEAQEKQTNLVYVKSYDEALKSTTEGANQLVFILNATKIGQVKAVAEAGEVMPQKSTYFYPKLLSGLVLNVHEGASTAAGA